METVVRDFYEIQLENSKYTYSVSAAEGTDVIPKNYIRWRSFSAIVVIATENGKENILGKRNVKSGWHYRGKKFKLEEAKTPIPKRVTDLATSIGIVQTPDGKFFPLCAVDTVVNP